MTKRNVIIIVLLVIGLVAIGACILGVVSQSSNSDTHGIDSGVVYSSRGKYVKVREDDGENDTHKVTEKVAKKCTVGKRWPDCKK